MVTANKRFVKRHPTATKRALRAILKATDICAGEPERLARFLVDNGYTTKEDRCVSPTPARHHGPTV
jgi:NitT/TauT family transport system substrate-binding protein